ncbi:hypothetical protein L596_013361 [Steinernema carpocapsae]|uniref:Uncharacterized protein n=1 Tax=Steinernema carpocapsae TaxID=34508 RepID=A0A4V6A523_STECR|nr:hypothetical protein L596_013361 [Steinernema carpocapsae]
MEDQRRLRETDLIKFILSHIAKLVNSKSGLATMFLVKPLDCLEVLLEQFKTTFFFLRRNSSSFSLAFGTMFRLASLFLLLPALNAGLPLNAPGEVLSQWESFTETHAKTYSSSQEEKRRYKVFLDNLKTINRLNNEHQGNATFAVNQFSDMTEEELGEMFPGESPDLLEDLQPFPALDTELYSPYFNWNRTLRMKVKDQQTCGSCYIFASVAAMEAKEMQKYPGTQWDLSEQKVLDCSGFGCNGNLVANAMQYLQDYGTVPSNEYVRYHNSKGQCKQNMVNHAHKYTIYKYRNLYDPRQNFENNIANMIATTGPVVVAMKARIPEVKYYRGGILSVNRNFRQGDTDHFMLAVGYGTDSSTAKKYWILKNSWGTRWGVGGFMYLERGTNQLNIGHAATYPVLNYLNKAHKSVQKDPATKRPSHFGF